MSKGHAFLIWLVLHPAQYYPLRTGGWGFYLTEKSVKRDENYFLMIP